MLQEAGRGVPIAPRPGATIREVGRGLPAEPGASAVGARSLRRRTGESSRNPRRWLRRLRGLVGLAGLLLGMVAEAGAAESEPIALTPKLAALFSAQDTNGQLVIAAAQRAYFDGLNDHLKAFLFMAVEKDLIAQPGHLGRLLALELRPQKMEILLQDNCLLCHTDPDSQSANSLFSLSPEATQSPAHMNLKDFLESAHFRRGLSCAGCHGGDPASEGVEHDFVKEWPEKGRGETRAWILDFCARCHSDATLINRFNPALPTDQLAKFKESPHGKLLLGTKDLRAPQCVSCHGVHGIQAAKNPQSMVHAKRIAETCGSCHANPKIMAGFTLPDGSPLPTTQLQDYRASVHGRALLERGDLGAPACNDCHGNHAAMPMGLSSVSQSCSLCHAANASLFDGSKHKQAFERHQWPQCAKCHGNHAIAKTQDAMLASTPTSLCVACHQQHAPDNPECNATAAYFYQTITHLERTWTTYQATAEELAMKGLDVDPIHNQLDDLHDHLKKARAYVHSFDRNSFQQVAAPADNATQTILALVHQARAEYRTRQAGLLASIAVTGLMMLAVYLKLRRLER